MKLTKEALQERSNTIHNFEYVILGSYVNINTKIEIEHLMCGNIFMQSPDKHSYGRGCPKCYGIVKSSTQEFQCKSDKLYNNEYNIIGEYVNNSTKIEIEHKICRSKFLQIPNNHLRGRKCPSCYGTPKKTIEVLQRESDKVHGGKYKILGEYNGMRSKITLMHKKCKNVFNQHPSYHMKGSGCPKCFNNISIGEANVKKCLESKNINFIQDKSFSGLKYKYVLRFDFYLPEHNVCVEFDGIQHKQPIEFFGGVSQFNEQVKKDSLKNAYCESNNIKLIRITNISEVENIINSL